MGEKMGVFSAAGKRGEGGKEEHYVQSARLGNDGSTTNINMKRRERESIRREAYFTSRGNSITVGGVCTYAISQTFVFLGLFNICVTIQFLFPSTFIFLLLLRNQ